MVCFVFGAGFFSLLSSMPLRRFLYPHSGLIVTGRLKDIILEIADDLHHDCRISEYGEEEDPEWAAKYFCNRRSSETLI